MSDTHDQDESVEVVPEDGGVAVAEEDLVDVETEVRARLLSDADAPKPPSMWRKVLRLHKSSESKASLDTNVELPLIDGHCHLMGKSVSKTRTSQKEHPEGRSKDGQPSSKEPKPRQAAGLLRFSFYNTAPDHKLAEKVVYTMYKFWDAVKTNKVRSIAAMPMLLDFGYTPLRTGPVSGKAAWATAENTKSSEGNALITDGDEDAKDVDLYYARDKQDKQEYVWYARDPASFEHQIKTLSNVSKLFPGVFWPFAPYDPRRPNGLKFVKKAIEELGCVGVKLYSRCGWMPYENRRMFGPDVGGRLDLRLKALYDYMVANDLPLLVHTSPTGYPPETATGIALPFRMTDQASKEEHKQLELWARGPFDEDSNLEGITAEVCPPYDWRPAGKGRATVEDAARNAACTLAHYCLYLQLTTSPYAWEPVLKKWPTLRLCFGHFGSKLSVFASDVYRVTDKQAEGDCHDGLATNPVVAPIAGSRSFANMFVEGVTLIAKSMYHTKAGGHWHFAKKAGEAWDKKIRLESESGWSMWHRSWILAYPHDWMTKIIKLFTKYDNVYADISFITGHKPSFDAIVGPLVEDGLGQRNGRERVKDKCIIGTDWFMTELQSLTPKDFWDLLYKCIKPESNARRKILWDLWATKNALRYVNLQPRLKGKGMETLETFYNVEKKELPPWWDKVKDHYTSGEYKEIPPYP